MATQTQNRLRLLMVDDDEQDRFLIKQALSEEFQLEAREIRGSADLTVALRQGPYDLALTDYTLGWSDGVTVADAIHNALPDCPIIMFSGTDLVSSKLLVRVVHANIADVVPKSGPDFGPLKAAVRRVTRPPKAPLQELADYRDSFSSVVADVVDYAIFLLDERGRVLTWNKGAERLKGYEASEIIGKSFETFYPPEDLVIAKPKILLEKAREYGHSEDEGWRVRKGGSRFWAHVTITAIRDKWGNVTGFCKVTRDLTERNSAEERLRRSEERFRVLVNSVRDYAIFLLDADGRIASWNRGAQEIKGYTEDEVIGKSIAIFYPPEDKGKFRRLLDEAAARGRVEDEGWRIRKDGSRFWADAIITALRDDQGRLVGFAKVTRDLSARKSADEEIERRSAELQALNRELDLFSSTVSHDLKAPLRQIASYASLLSRHTLDEESTAFVERINLSIGRLTGMIEELLAYSRLSRETLPLAAVDTEETLNRVLEQQSGEIAQRHAVLDVQRPLPPVMANASTLERVLENLLGNALKFVAQGAVPNVTIRATTSGSRVLLFVEDRGIGIPPELEKKLFQPFQRGHGKESFPGHGLGLAIVLRSLERMNGKAGFTPRPGGGSSFWIELQGCQTSTFRK